ncbi:hypothetical protein ACSBR1_034719 [Camellia fascicularis]
MTTSNLDFQSEITTAPLNSSQFHHTPFCCEENVYLLCKKLCTSGVADAEGSDIFVVFISNEKKFHCGIRRPARELMELFCGIITSSAFRFFRVVHAPIFLRSFASDRRHMKDSVGNLIAQPPAYEAIVAEDGTVHNVNEYIEISTAGLAKDIGVDLIDAVHSQKLGVTVSETQLEEFFSLIS